MFLTFLSREFKAIPGNCSCGLRGNKRRKQASDYAAVPQRFTIDSTSSETSPRMHAPRLPFCAFPYALCSIRVVVILLTLSSATRMSWLHSGTSPGCCILYGNCSPPRMRYSHRLCGLRDNYTLPMQAQDRAAGQIYLPNLACLPLIHSLQDQRIRLTGSYTVICKHLPSFQTPLS